MAQGLDLKNWDDQKSPSTESKSNESGKRNRSIGSRRIFPPQFKLQVLDSYRNDSDCRGNQRATARKYNIHRRQIQKWLQCEQNLRSSVGEAGIRRRDTTVVAADETPVAAAEAEADADEGEVEEDGKSGKASRKLIGDGKSDATLNRSAMIYARLSDAERTILDSSWRRINLDAWNLKRVAQKLYPAETVDVSGSKTPIPTGARTVSTPPPRCDPCSEGFVASQNNGQSTKPMEILPKECCKTDDKPIEIFTRRAENAIRESEPDPVSDRLNVGETSQSESCNIERQKLCDENAECLVQKYTDSGEGPKFRKNELLCSRELDSESSCLLDTGAPKLKPEAVESKSFTPKRKWMQESMQEERSYSTLPIKQRVKMDLKSAAASSKGVSPNFTIEKLCASDIKSEKAVTPCYNWQPETGYPGYPNPPPLSLPFPPPLLLTHRVIPDLVSLHFKPESARSEQAVKEEKISDGEESADIDVLSTTPVEKKSFDFAGFNLGKRRSFSVQFKLTVLDAFYNDKDCNKNQRATARKFNINRRQVQKWLSQENDLRSEGSIKNGKYLQRQRLGVERDLEAESEGCKQCPQHCSNRKRKVTTTTTVPPTENDKTIELNLKHCTDKECLTREKSSPDSSVSSGSGSSSQFGDGFEFYGKSGGSYYQSDLKSANIYENYFVQDNSSALCHDSFLGWPNFNSSALPVPNFHYLSSWYYNFHYCHEKSKIY